MAALAAPVAAQTPVMPILDHIHLNVPDQAKAVEWYQKNFGGTPIAEAPDRLMFGDTRLIFLKNDKGQPSTGSALDHLGFSFADLDAKMKEFEAAGVKVVTPVRDVAGLFKLGSSSIRGARASRSCRIQRSWACTTCICVDRIRRRYSPSTRRSSPATSASSRTASTV
jgi:catechol 2,3-dioxygenase-like lactoylglutathione lyase family enzyme